MSNSCVTLVLKAVIYFSKLLYFQHFASLALEHHSSDTRNMVQTSDFMDKH